MIEELKGKTLHGAEIFYVRHGREEVPQETQDMGRKLGHEPNTSTGLWFQASVKVKGKTYMADLRWTPDEGNECMILRFTGRSYYSRRGIPLALHSLLRFTGRSYYSRRGIPLTLPSLLKCIDEFAKDGGPKDGGRPRRGLSARK